MNEMKGRKEEDCSALSNSRATQKENKSELSFAMKAEAAMKEINKPKEVMSTRLSLHSKTFTNLPKRQLKSKYTVPNLFKIVSEVSKLKKNSSQSVV